jgi:hypothetical protein
MPRYLSFTLLNFGSDLPRAYFLFFFTTLGTTLETLQRYVPCRLSADPQQQQLPHCFSTSYHVVKIQPKQPRADFTCTNLQSPGA